MVTVAVTVEAYPFDGATGLEVEELTGFGWVNRLDTSEIGAFPDYTTTYTVTVADPSNRLRVRWMLAAGSTSWFSPTTVAITPTAADQERLDQAVLAKALRTYALAQAPLGTHGEVTEFGQAKVMPDYQITELLAGLVGVNWDYDLDTVTAVDVIRLFGGYDPAGAGWTPEKTADVERALQSARSWVASHLLDPVPIS